MATPRTPDERKEDGQPVSSRSAHPATARIRHALRACLIGILCSLCALAASPPGRLVGHSRANHHALQAQSWLAGNLDLPNGAPKYTGNNDFAVVNGRSYVSFPPGPTVLIVPLVAARATAERTPDAAFFIGLSGCAPAFLFLALYRLKEEERLGPRPPPPWLIALLFGLGSVYWFSAAQGTVWFAGHVVATSALCGAIWLGVGGKRPAATGLLFALAIASRPTLSLCAPWFVGEWLRLPPRRRWSTLFYFAMPVISVGAALAWYNAQRFGSPFEFGHQYLAIRWRGRIDQFGLFSHRYLGKNLAVVLTGLPFWSRKWGLQYNAHGLALWVTTPLYLALALRHQNEPRALTTRRFALFAAAPIALAALLYQNTGWVQFGYRFSNDYAPFLFIAIAGGGLWSQRRRLFLMLAATGVLVNALGAATFDHPHYRRRIVIERTQQLLHAPEP